MSDSVDRVFVHALSTVKKIPRTGSARPPPAERLKLYGLYKQSMEGDIVGVMDRPRGHNEEERAERAKWDAWNQQHGLSKTEAKRRYISTLIDAMHNYASSTPESRELVSELEFVWDQIKSNVSSSSSSSPLLTSDMPIPQSLIRQRESGMRIISPVSPNDDEDDEQREYLEARTGDTSDDEDPHEDSIAEVDQVARRTSNTDMVGWSQRGWRRKVEHALVKLAAEVAALREQIESSSQHTVKKSPPLLTRVFWGIGASIRHILIDALILGIVIVWMQRWRRRDPRLDETMNIVSTLVREYAGRLSLKRQRLRS